MPQLTIDVPETLMPLLIQKAAAFGETLEKFIVNWLSTTLECLNDDVAMIVGIDPEGQARIEGMVEERDKGPSIPPPRD